MASQIELVALFAEVLRLCKLDANERFAVLTENNLRQDYADAYLEAAATLGCQGFQVNVRSRQIFGRTMHKQTGLSGNMSALQALRSVDLLIDLVGLLWSREQRLLQDSGTRILLSREPVEILRRMFPSPQLRKRVEAAARLLAPARKMRITSAAGTDVVYRLGRFPIVTQYGYTDEPGRWDNLSAGGFLYTGAWENGVDGVVVINQGDIIFPFKRYVQRPIRLEVREGLIQKIEGEGNDADLLREYLRRFDDSRAYAISHIGWGMDDKGRWEFMGTDPLGRVSGGVDGRSFLGNVLFSTGPNLELGGSNDTACHLDIPLRHCTVWLDDRVIIEQGRHIAPDLLDSPSV
ncbi:MAG: leucyl aminopeptidase [Pirellulales bacterium]